jgi:hypothetical protein
VLFRKSILARPQTKKGLHQHTPKPECSNLTVIRSNVAQQYQEIIAVKAEVQTQQASSSDGNTRSPLALITELVMVVTHFDENTATLSCEEHATSEFQCAQEPVQ